MTTIMTKVEKRRIEVDVPSDWPDGTEVEINPVSSISDTHEWERMILETASKWQGGFVRPAQGEFEERESLSDGAACDQSCN